MSCLLVLKACVLAIQAQSQKLHKKEFNVALEMICARTWQASCGDIGVCIYWSCNTSPFDLSCR